MATSEEQPEHDLGASQPANEGEKGLITIKPPGDDISTEPDKYTKKAPDMTGPYADKRVFFINTKIFRYGTSDQGHAAALVLSAFMLFVILFLGVIALLRGADMTLLQFLVSPFSLVAGVAVGKSLGNGSHGDGE